MRLIYIAGRYRGKTKEKVKLNIKAATAMGVLVAEGGTFYPVIPHTNTMHFEHLTDNSDKYFLDGTMEMMRRCDGVLLVPGWQCSTGTLGEIAEAQRLGIPVFYEIDELWGHKWPVKNVLTPMEVA